MDCRSPKRACCARAMLDKQLWGPRDFVRTPSDRNYYIWGRIGDHNVVIAWLPAGKKGSTSPAATTLPMLAFIPQIRIGLLVGIGAGISKPNKGRDIHLGDVAVSQPHGNTGGVIQYDQFKAKPGGQREGAAFLNNRPDAYHETELPEMLEYLEEAIARKPILAREGYVHQGFKNDRLFKTLDPKTEIQRVPRDLTDPQIHYGTIASGNTISKDGAYRDELLAATGEECICFEMEAAGLMNEFPCVVIKGISDYADLHKSEKWHRYAAITAAAYAKELLHHLPCQDLETTQKAVNNLEKS
ncbi:nucleoside phosphorylase domain-containing protein [Aspergillus filifer]